MKKILILLTCVLLIGSRVFAAGDLLVTGNLGVGTTTPDNKIVVTDGKIKTIGTYQNQGFIADYVAPGDDSTATALTSGLNRGAFLFSKCEGCSNGFHSFAIQARSRANVLLGSPSRPDTVFEITEYGMTSIGKYEPAAWLDVSASGYTNIDLFRLSSTDATNGDMFIVKNTGNVGIGTIAPTEKLYVTGNIYATGNVTWGSSRELKKDIQDISTSEAVTALNSLSPKKYFYKADDKDGHLGFIAEDVPDMLATYDRKSLDPMDIVAVLTKVVQEQQKISEQSEKVLLQQQKTISELSGKVADLEKALKLKNSLASAEIYLH